MATIDVLPSASREQLVALLAALRARRGNPSLAKIAMTLASGTARRPSRGHLSQVFNGQKIPSPELAAELVTALGGSVADTQRAQRLALIASADNRKSAQASTDIAKTNQSETAKIRGAFPALWNAPVRNVLFTGRIGELTTIDQLSRAGRKTRRAVLRGIGGVGKSSIAVEYLHIFKSSFSICWWVNAENRLAIADGLQELSREAGWVTGQADSAEAVAEVQRRLRRLNRWVLVFDNVTDAADLADYLPVGPGLVIATSRASGFSEIAEVIDVDVPPRPESVELLRAGVPAVLAETADIICGELGDLPLAVSQAVGFMKETGVAPEQYLQHLSRQAVELMSEPPSPLYPQSLAATIEIAIDRMRGEPGEPGVRLIRVLALLGGASIPVDLVAHLADDQDTPGSFRSSVDALRALRKVTGLGLARTTPGEVQVHRLTKLIVMSTTPPSDLHDHLRAASEAVTRFSPADYVAPEMWTKWFALMPHILALLEHGSTSERLREVSCDLSWAVLARGHVGEGFNLALGLYQRWIAIHGDDDRLVLRMANNVAHGHRLAGRYGEAELVDRNTFEMRRSKFGPDNPDTLASANNLALDYRLLGRAQAALDLDLDTHRRRVAALGSDDRLTLIVASNIALNLHTLGLYDQALDRGEELVARWRRLVGEDHPHYFSAVNNLALTQHALRRFDEARSNNEQLLAKERAVLGEKHPDTLTTASNLSRNFAALELFDMAIELDIDLLDKQVEVLGRQHPYTRESLDNLVADLRMAGRYEQAAQARKKYR